MTQQGDAVRERLEKRWPRIEEPKPEKLVADGRVWSKVRAPKAWRPHNAGEVLIGEYIGRSPRAGSYGPYSVVTIRTTEGARTVSGIVINDLFDSINPETGTLVRIVFKGERPGCGDRNYRDFEVFIATDEEPPVVAEGEEHV